MWVGELERGRCSLNVGGCKGTEAGGDKGAHLNGGKGAMGRALVHSASVMKGVAP